MNPVQRFGRSSSAAGVLRRALPAAVVFAAATAAAPAYDVHFDYTSFDNPGKPGVSPHFGQNQFNVLNYPSLNGNYMMTSTDTHRPEMVANNNALAEFYNNFLADYNTQYRNNAGVLDAVAEADAINAYTLNHSTSNGPRPNYLLLNELSASVWPDTTQKGIDYRAWCIGVVTRLHDTYGYNVVTFAPFATVGLGRAPDWQLLTAKSSVGVENYLSGQEVMTGGTDYGSRVAWAQAQYQASVNTYAAAGVPKSKLVLTEEFANTVAGTGWGRAGLSAADWDTVIQIRQDAIRNVGFPGFAAYAWGSNGMLITEAEQIQHEYFYRSRLVLPTQQPQWLMDDAVSVNTLNLSLSWGEPLDWIGGVPDAPGAVANFFRTNTAARTITLDAPRTVGTLTFDSPNSYTIAPGGGGGGMITLANGDAVATMSVASGAHTIAAPVVAFDSAHFDVAAGAALTLSGALSNSGPRVFTKTGGGALTFSGAQSHAAGSTFVTSGGTTTFNTDAGPGLAVTANAAVNFGVTQHLAALTVGAGNTATLAGGGAKVLNVESLSVAGKLDLKDNALTVRNGEIGSWNGSAYTGVTGSIASGRSHGSWTGSGIVTTVAAPNDYTTLGIATPAEVLGIPFDTTATWHGESVAGASLLVAYTYGGDANLDGVINIDDYTQIDSSVSVGGSLKGWFNGDFNYDGNVDIDDYTIIDSNIATQGPPFPTATGGVRVSGVTAVPEPAFAVVPAVIGTASALRRGRRGRRRTGGGGLLPR